MSKQQTTLIAEIAAIAVFGVICAVMFARLEAFERVFELSRSHAHWHLDKIAGVFMAAALCLPVIMARCNRWLSRAGAEAVHRATRIDALTGLQNLLALNDALAVLAARQTGRMPYLLMIDLDRFKSINDLRGHAAGDAILGHVAHRLSVVSSLNGLVFRTGGDEFAIVIDTVTDAQQAAGFAADVVAAVAEPYCVGDWTEMLNCSIGIAAIEPGAQPSEIVHRADQAMYHAKVTTATGWALFDEALGNALRGKALLEAELRIAIMDNALVPFFQPILKIETGELIGFEVLARWHREASGYVPPDVFIPMAEDMGLIDRLSDQLLRKCCIAMKAWDTSLMLSFNLSPRQLNQSNLAERIRSILQAHDIGARRLAIEITETAVFIDMDRARTVISQLRALGIRVSLDDFGIGTSSLAVLSQLPFDTIKIDRSFISNIGDNPQNAKIVRGVLALARSLELTVTAEGIESGRDLDFLRENNCILGQGYYFSRPVPEDALPQLIEDVARAAALARGDVAELPPAVRHVATATAGLTRRGAS